MRAKWSKSAQPAPGAHVKDRLGRLAARVEALAEKDEQQFRRTREMALLRQNAAERLYHVCADFTSAVNALLPQPELKLDPPEYPPTAFREDGVNLLQINVRGRILQIEFEATPQLVSTEDFRIPYTLAGSVRCFNQEFLDRSSIDEQLLFYCLDHPGGEWRFFDARTYRAGPFDRDYLITLMEQLL